MSIIVHTHDGQRIELAPASGDTLAKVIFLGGLWQDVPLCSGLGKCGLCRVRYISDAPTPASEEVRKLGSETLAQGWRLACLHLSEPCEIELPEPARNQRNVSVVQKTTGNYTLAVDLGTTSLHWTALVDKTAAASGRELNPQMGLGSEIMSRLAIASSEKGRSVLRSLITDRLTQLTKTLSDSLGGRCTGLAVSGNPAMTYILLGMKPDGLATAPYTLSYTGGDEQVLSEGLPPAYIPPLLAPFVGADLSAGLTAIEYIGKPRYPFLLADLGTNGEFILALSPHKRICASVPMGPALEGVGLTFGRTAGPGAITGFTLTPTGLQPTFFEGQTTGRPGMTGTGYLSLVAILLRHGVLDETGHFTQGATPLAARLAANVTSINNEPAFRINDDLFLPASDVEEILKVKAAFNLAMSVLLDTAGFGPSGLAAIHLAGALGEHVGIDDLEAVGFLPPTVRERVVRVSNTSLAGTELLVNDTDARTFAEQLPETATVLDLTGDDDFGDQYLKRMHFTYVD